MVFGENDLALDIISSRVLIRDDLISIGPSLTTSIKQSSADETTSTLILMRCIS